MLSALHTLLLRQRPYRYVGERIPCNLCDGTDFVVVARRDRWLNPLTNSLCRHCGLVGLDPMPTDAEVARFYAGEYRRRYAGSTEPTPKHLLRSRRSAELRLAMLKPRLRPGMRALDVGSGSGEFLAALRDAGCVVEGVEPDASFARFAEQNYDVQVHAAPFADVDFSGRSFDLITSWHVLEHFRDPFTALRRIHSLLAPGGFGHFVVPYLAEPHSTPMTHYHFAHLHGFTRQTFAMMALKAGFASADDLERGTGPLFCRLDAPAPDWFRYPTHAQQLEAYLKGRTVFSILSDGESWRRMVRRARNFLSDRLTLRRLARRQPR
jgi:SAM-dependent methyltransferase